MSESKSKIEPTFRHPKYWPTWCLIWLLKSLARLPHARLIKLGYVFGGAAFHLATRRRRIAEKNIELCFPELGPAERADLVRQTINNNVIGLFETIWAGYGDTSSMHERLTIEGAENLENALALGRGVLLVGAHYTTLDLGSLMTRPVAPVTAIYAPNKNPLMDKFIYEGRKPNLEGVIDRRDMRAMVRALKKGSVVWYSPDQDYGAAHSVFAPFFGINAASVKMTAKLAAFNNSPIVILSHHREPDDEHYRVRFRPALENYPTGDEFEDAKTINEALEREIRLAPSQYMWVHRRFKSQPEGTPSPYS